MHELFSGIGAGMSLLAALSSSSTLQLNNYSLGTSASNAGRSTTFYIEGSTGELQSSSTLSATYQTDSGSQQSQQASVPTAPTLSNNSGAYFNKLLITIATGGNATDALYSIAISTNNFVTTNYVQADGTVAATPVYRTYAQWGGASGSFITGLLSNTAYKAKVDAMQGLFTATSYGPAASATTGIPNLSFSLPTTSFNLPTLSIGSATTATASLNYATNAGNGGYVYVMGQNAGLRSIAANYTIPSNTGSLTAAQGFGLRSTAASQASGGPFVVVAPFNAAVNSVGAVSTVLQPMYSSAAGVVGATATFTIGASRNATTPAANDYQELMTFVAAASF